jgi:hypothetical protein
MNLSNKKGIATVLGFVVILILAVLASTMLMRGVSGSRRTEIYVDQTRAYWLAEAGIERALWELNNGAGAWTGWKTDGSDKILQGSVGTSGDYDITVYDYLTPPLRIEVTGFFPDRFDPTAITRSLEIIADESVFSLFEYAAYSQDKLTLGGQAYTDSYDSALGAYGGANVGAEGDVGSGVEVEASGNVYVDGDVVVPEGGAAPDEKYYSGTVNEEDNPPLTSVTVPANLVALPSGGSISTTTTLGPGDYQYWMINLSSKSTLTITGPANIYLTGATSINVSGMGDIVVDAASTGPVNIYFDGDVNLSGQAIVNQTALPSNLIMYGTNPIVQTVNLAGQTDFHGAVYAPNATLNLTGQGGMFGSFVGDEVNISGQGGIHYDVSLGKAGGTGVIIYIITSIRDIQSPYSLSP